MSIEAINISKNIKLIIFQSCEPYFELFFHVIQKNGATNE